MNKLAKGTAGVNYSSCESLDIDTADRATGSTVWGNTVALITFSSFIESITINGGDLWSPTRYT